MQIYTIRCSNRPDIPLELTPEVNAVIVSNLAHSG